MSCFRNLINYLQDEFSFEAAICGSAFDAACDDSTSTVDSDCKLARRNGFLEHAHESGKLVREMRNGLQVLEQMESGPVSLNLITRVKAHPLYEHRPMVSELLESIIAAQPPSVQKQASKIIQQQSQVRKTQIRAVLSGVNPPSSVGSEAGNIRQRHSSRYCAIFKNGCQSGSS